MKTLSGILFTALFLFNTATMAQSIPVAVEKLIDDIQKNLNVGSHIRNSKEDFVAFIRSRKHREISDIVMSSLTDDELVEYSANRADFRLICATENIMRIFNNDSEENHPNCDEMEWWMNHVKIETKDDMTNFLRIFAQRKPSFVGIAHKLITSRHWEVLPYAYERYSMISLIPKIGNYDYETYIFITMGLTGLIGHKNGQAKLLMTGYLWDEMNTPSIRPLETNF